MKKKANLSSILYLIIFVLFIGVAGLISDIKLIKFYVTDETNYNEYSESLGSRLEVDLDNNVFAKSLFINGNGIMRLLIGQREMNGVVRLNNNYLTTPIKYTSDESLETYAQNTLDFYNNLKARGIELLYVSSPYTVSPYDPCLPAGTEDYGNDNIDRFLTYLDSYGVHYLDFRQIFYDDGIDQYDMFFRTDHHWTPKAGFYAYQKIDTYVCNTLGISINPTVYNLDNYNVTTYKNLYMGSEGSRTCPAFAAADDFDIIEPTFHTNIESMKNGDTGTIQDLIINTSYPSSSDFMPNYVYENVYGKSNNNYINHENPNGKKLLIISDSFSKVVNPYLILEYSQLKTVSNVNVEIIDAEYLDEYQPDMVILIYYADKLKEDSRSFSFNDF